MTSSTMGHLLILAKSMTQSPAWPNYWQRTAFEADTGRSAFVAGTAAHAPKATFAPRPRESIEQPGKQSFDRAASLLSHDGTTAKTGPRYRAVVHDPDADTHDAASAIVAPKVRGSRTVNSVNSPTWLDTDGAAMLLGHDVVTDRKAEARPPASRLRGEERLKELVFDLRWNANSVVSQMLISTASPRSRVDATLRVGLYFGSLAYSPVRKMGALVRSALAWIKPVSKG